MQDLKEVTQDFHYENYRAQRLSTPPGTPGTDKKKRYRTKRKVWIIFGYVKWKNKIIVIIFLA